MVMDETSAQYLYRMIKKLMVKHEIDDLEMISRGSGYQHPRYPPF